jgi:ferredoxin
MGLPTNADEIAIGARLGRLADKPARPNRDVSDRFAARLREVAAHPDRVPIRLNGEKVTARNGGTVLAASLKNGVRLMHVCGARTLCATCRVKVVEGEENLSPMSLTEKLSLRYHLSVSPRARLACQARVEGPVEIETVFPLCGSLPGER